VNTEKNYLIAVTGDKGGVGKSTLTALFVEWLLFKGHRVRVIDADPNQTTQTWLDKCAEMGRTISSVHATLTLVDTAGTSGASLNKYIINADLILVPFKPHVADLEVIAGWFYSLKESMQTRVRFIPNMLTRTKEQGMGYQQLSEAVREEGKGEIISGLRERNAVYPPLLNGSAKNFFAGKLNLNTRKETDALFQHIAASLRELTWS